MFETVKRWFNWYWKQQRDKAESVPITVQQIYMSIEKDDVYCEVVDRDYKTCELDVMKSMVALIPIKLQTYLDNDQDCDDYAWQFRAVSKKLFPKLPIGYVHVNTPEGKHALNFCIYTFKGQPRFAYIEPQTGKIVNSISGYEPYLYII